MIETLSLRNFKVLREVDVRLRPLTLIVGPNASGKSSILQALDCWTSSLVNGSNATFQGERASEFLLSRKPEGPLSVAGVAHYTDNELRNRLTFGSRGVEFHGIWNGNEFREILPSDLREALRPAASLEFDVKQLAAPAYLAEITRVLPRTGRGLAWILAHLNLAQPTRFQELVERLVAIVPAVEGIRLQPAYVWQTETEEVGPEVTAVRRRYNGFELLFDMKGATGIPAHAVSEGTLLTLGLLTLLASPESPQLVLIDDLERGLHPKALGDLILQLRRLQEQDPELQIVATSHSPYLLDYLQADEILLTSLREDGYAAVKPLTDHPEYERWKDVMAPGEFWSTVGERWVTEQTPR